MSQPQPSATPSASAASLVYAGTGDYIAVDHSVWLNTIPADEWDRAYGATTIRLIREVFPMFELTVDGLTAATRKLMVRR